MDNNDSNNQKPQFDPAGETKQKFIFLAVAVVAIVILKVVLGF